MVYKTTVGAIFLFLLASSLIYTLPSSLPSLDPNKEGKNHLRPGGRVEDQDQDHTPPPSTIIDTVKTLFSLPNTRLALLQAAASNYWIKLKTILKFRSAHRQIDLSTAPDLDFRRRKDNDRMEARSDGTGEKLEEAVVKSFDKGKEVIEDSARSAAKFVEESAKKVKRTLSDTEEEL